MSKIPYDLTKIRAIAFDIDGVLSPAVVPLGDDGIPRRMTNLKDGYALRLATRLGYQICIISGADGPGLRERFAMLGVQNIWLSVGDKKELFEQWMQNQGLKIEEVVYVGDDVPDIDCLQCAGLAVCPADAAPDVMAVCDYISPAQGGYGVARDVLEEIIRAAGRWPKTDIASI